MFVLKNLTVENSNLKIEIGILEDMSLDGVKVLLRLRNSKTMMIEHLKQCALTTTIKNNTIFAGVDIKSLNSGGEITRR